MYIKHDEYIIRSISYLRNVCWEGQMTSFITLKVMNIWVEEYRYTLKMERNRDRKESGKQNWSLNKIP